MKMFNRILLLLLCISIIGNLFLFISNDSGQNKAKKLPLQAEYIAINPTLINKTNKGYEITYSISYADKYKDLFELDTFNTDSLEIIPFMHFSNEPLEEEIIIDNTSTTYVTNAIQGNTENIILKDGEYTTTFPYQLFNEETINNIDDFLNGNDHLQRKLIRLVLMQNNKEMHTYETSIES